MKSLSLLIFASFIISSCTTTDEIVTPEATEPVKNSYKPPKTNITYKKLGKYEIDIDRELQFTDDIKQLNSLNKMSTNPTQKNSHQQLLDSLFAKKNRKAKDIELSYLKIIQEKKRKIRLRISEKRDHFFSDRQKKRQSYADKASLKKKNFNHKTASAKIKKNFYNDLNADRNLFFANQDDSKKLFEENVKSMEVKIKSKFKDLNKDFESRLKIFRLENN